MEPLAVMLFMLAIVQGCVGLLLLGPKILALPVARLIRPRGNGLSSPIQAVVMTVAAGLAGVLVFSVFQLLQVTKGDSNRVESRDTHGDVLAAFDKMRAQVTCALSAATLLLLFLLRSLAEHLVLYNSSLNNLEAMKRQAKGMLTEYERVTGAGEAAAGTTGGSDDAAAAARAASQSQLDRLTQENAALVAAAGEKDKLLRSAELKGQAMESQWKGFETEYDRVLAESQQLQKRLLVLEHRDGGAPGVGGSLGKKDS